MKIFATVLTLALVWLGVGANSEAHAATLSGKLTVEVNQGQFCDPATSNCTDALFPKSHIGFCRPVRKAIIRIETSAGALLKHAETDLNGDYTATFNWSGGNVRVKWLLFNSENRFRVADETSANYGGTRASVSGATSLGGGTATKTLNWCFGNTVYHQAWIGADRMWQEALKQSPQMVAKFTNVSIVAESSEVDEGRGKYTPERRLVHLGEDSAFFPLSDTQHELGHAAHHVSNTGIVFTTAYNYAAACGANCCPDGDCGDESSWTMTTPEYQNVSFQEGIATFAGLRAMYGANAVQPLFCSNASGACSATAGNNMEVRPAGACGADESRFPRSAVRYFWDVFDMVDDADYADAIGAGTSAAFTFGTLVDELSTYAAGFGNGQLNEPWLNASFDVMDDGDGRSPADYQAKLNGTTTLQRTNNCSP